MQQYADIYLLQSDFAVNKYLHTVASGWIFINNDEAYSRFSKFCECCKKSVSILKGYRWIAKVPQKAEIIFIVLFSIFVS